MTVNSAVTLPFKFVLPSHFLEWPSEQLAKWPIRYPAVALIQMPSSPAPPPLPHLLALHSVPPSARPCCAHACCHRRTLGASGAACGVGCWDDAPVHVEGGGGVRREGRSMYIEGGKWGRGLRRALGRACLRPPTEGAQLQWDK